MKIFTSILVVLIFAFTCHAQAGDLSKWTYEDTGLQLVFAGLLVADWNQTLQISRNPDKYFEKEAAWLIGKHPSKIRVNTYFLSYLIANTLLATQLNKPYRTFFQGFYIIYEHGIIQHNRKFGLGVSLRF